jgi:hypothetical protein
MSRIKLKISMEHWWNNIDKEKLKYSEKNLPQYHLVHRKLNMDWPETELGSPRWDSSHYLPEPGAGV